MESQIDLVNCADPFTGMANTSGGGTSFHLQPKVAATDGHRSLSFGGMRTESGGTSGSSALPRRTSTLSSASGRSSLTPGKSVCVDTSDRISEELSVAKSGKLV
jgi:hypothetical protein